MRGEITLAESELPPEDGTSSREPATPQWLVDEMLGKLARYLRILGCDAEYVRGLADAEILTRLASSHRQLVTRDELLAKRAPHSTLLRAVGVREQLQELWQQHPELPRAPRFTRCTLCNGVLVLEDSSQSLPVTVESSGDAGARPSERFRCAKCGQQYWRGSHTAHLERDLASWAGSVP